MSPARKKSSAAAPPSEVKGVAKKGIEKKKKTTKESEENTETVQELKENTKHQMKKVIDLTFIKGFSKVRIPSFLSVLGRDLPLHVLTSVQEESPRDGRYALFRSQGMEETGWKGGFGIRIQPGIREA